MIDDRLSVAYDTSRKGGEFNGDRHKIKSARMNASLTQEEVAEALGVSRQTISNWENEKTYPDIMSVVKMSDLYNISLDNLLKEKQSMSNYLNYLEESTNTVKSNKKLSMTILVITYLGIWAISLIVFWLFSSPSDAMGYSIMFLWVLLPVTTFTISLLIGKSNYWGNLKWIFSVVFGVMYMFAEYATYGAANMADTNKFKLPQFEMILAGAIISILGMIIGIAINHLISSKRKKEQIA